MNDSEPEDYAEAASDMHRKLWPGFHVPQATASKYRPFSVRNSAGHARSKNQEWLGSACVPTSRLIAYITWAFCHWKRSLEDRMPPAHQFQKLLLKLSMSFNSGFNLMISRLGQHPPIWQCVSVDCSLNFNASNLWPQDVQQLTLLQSIWNAYTLAADHILTSSFQHPTLSDFLFFSLDPKNYALPRVPGLASLALCMLTQIAFLLDERVVTLSREVAGIKKS